MNTLRTIEETESAVAVRSGDLLCQVLRLCNKAVKALNNRYKSKSPRKWKKWDNACSHYLKRANHLQRHNDKVSHSRE